MKTSAHRSFILGEIFSMTLSATTQRANLYAADTTENARQPFRKALRAALEGLSRLYTVEVKDEQHVEHIAHIANDLSTNYANLLSGKRFRIGQSQKAVNLYLKYLWCLGDIMMPPHCPIDVVVFRHIPGFKEERWTQLDSIDRYK